VSFPAASPAAAKAVAVALAQRGKPYVFATSGPETFDCSGLTAYAWGAAGVSMDHWTVAQWRQFPHVPLDALQPGDLVFFGSDIHHVGLFIGGGQMVDAPYTGAVVRVQTIYSSGLAGAVRPG
jgi:peptidoglycan DL-endopeptidase CwlO